MNVIGKIIAIIAFVLMILLIVNYKVLIPYFSNVILGGETPSPFQIGASYVDQANKLSPYGAMTGQKVGSAQTGAVTYGSYLAAQQQAQGVPGTRTPVSRGRITVEKIDTRLTLTTEGVFLSASNSRIHIWLTNSPIIDDNTKFIDFGTARSGSIQTYGLDLDGSNISLQEYKHVMIVDTETYEIYGQSVLGS